MMVSSFRLLALSLSLAGVLSLSACDANISVNVPNPQASASSSPEPAPQASNAPDPQASTAPAPQAPASTAPSSDAAATGKLTISGAALFDKYNIDFRQGMRWVYSMKMPAIDVAIPELPAGFPGGITIPGVGGGSTELGTFTMEVIRVEGNLVTTRTSVNMTLTSAVPPMAPTETTFEKTATANLYSEAFANGGSGTLSWQADSSESLSVPAGTYSTDRLKGRMDVLVDSNGTQARLEQDIKLWMAPGVGMVKQENVSSTSTSGVSGDVTVVMELTSFSG